MNLPHRRVLDSYPLDQDIAGAVRLHKLRSEVMPFAENPLAYRNSLLSHLFQRPTPASGQDLPASSRSESGPSGCAARSLKETAQSVLSPLLLPRSGCDLQPNVAALRGYVG